MAEMQLNIEGLRNSGNTISSGVATIMSGVASLSGLPCPRGLTGYGSIAAAAGQITTTATSIGTTNTWVNSIIESFNRVEVENNAAVSRIMGNTNTKGTLTSKILSGFKNLSETVQKNLDNEWTNEKNKKQLENKLKQDEIESITKGIPDEALKNKNLLKTVSETVREGIKSQETSQKNAEEELKNAEEKFGNTKSTTRKKITLKGLSEAARKNLNNAGKAKEERENVENKLNKNEKEFIKSGVPEEEKNKKNPIQSISEKAREGIKNQETSQKNAEEELKNAEEKFGNTKSTTREKITLKGLSEAARKNLNNAGKAKEEREEIEKQLNKNEKEFTKTKGKISDSKTKKTTSNTSKVLLEDQLKAEMIGSAIIDMINNANSDNKTTSNTSKVLLEDQLKSEMIGSAIIDIINNANSSNKSTPKEEVKIDSKKENKTTIKKSEKTTNISSFYDKTEESHSSKNEEYKLEKENVFGKLEDEISRISISFENTIKDEKNKDTLINKFKDYINTTIEVVYESMSEFKNEDMDFAKTVMAGVAEQLSIKDNTLIKAGNDEAFKKIVINKEIIRVLVKDKALGKQINERLKLITIDEIENLKKNVQKENQEQAEKLIKELTSGLKYIETADKKNLSAEFQQLVEKVIKEQ